MRPSSQSGCSATDIGECLPDSIKRRIGCIFDPPVIELLRAAPSHLSVPIHSIESLFDACTIRTAASALCDHADRGIELRGHLEWMAGNGFSREQSRQIRYVVETFHRVEPVLAVIAEAARQLLSGQSMKPGPSENGCRPGFVVPGAEIEFASVEDAIALFKGFAGQRPHAFLRALAVWPSYARKVQHDLTADRRAALHKVGADLQSRAKLLVFQSESGSEPLLLTGTADLIRALDDCLAASCEVIPLIAALRNGFIADEVSARRRCT